MVHSYLYHDTYAFINMRIIYFELTIWRNWIGTEQKQCFLWCKFDTFTNHIMKLTNSQICRYEVFLLIDVRNITSICLFTNDWDSIWIFGTDPFSFRFSLFYNCILFCEDWRMNQSSLRVWRRNNNDRS